MLRPKRVAQPPVWKPYGLEAAPEGGCPYQIRRKLLKLKGPYIKHVYWLTEDEEENLRQELAGRDIKLKSAKGIVCTPLDRINKITSVPPEVWNDTCNRQGSWYRTSDKNGLYLVISSFELEGHEDKKAATITESDFVPPRLANIEDKKSLILERSLKKRMPDDWLHPGDFEKRIYLRWARRLGSDVEDYDFLYLSHTANHANFIEPRFFIKDGKEIIPYSIDRSAHLCSCCVELFQVLGGGYKKKMVAPCPGATIFARLKPDRYLLVEKA
ncbi:MAG: hypothetical protein JRJ86_20565 [Deltaproteobacteria bacterium]|nr:hypothetical protein [Deltaproteobacteria bacterium]